MPFHLLRSNAAFLPKRFEDHSSNGPFGDTVEYMDWTVGELLKAVADNGLEQVHMHQGDAHEFIQQLPNHSYDLTICDPPKLSTNKKGIDAALKRLRAASTLSAVNILLSAKRSASGDAWLSV